MEDARFRLMRLLQDNPDRTQRELAEGVGLSVGAVNYCLRALADKPHLFHSAYAREHWEAPARANLERELGVLEPLSPGSDTGQ